MCIRTGICSRSEVGREVVHDRLADPQDRFGPAHILIYPTISDDYHSVEMMQIERVVRYDDDGFFAEMLEPLMESLARFYVALRIRLVEEPDVHARITQAVEGAH